MKCKLFLALLFLLFIFQGCQSDYKNLSRFKNLEYNYLFSGTANYSIKQDYIYIKNLNLQNQKMLVDIQEFILCYAKSHPDVAIICISYKNIYPSDEFNGKYIKIITYMGKREDKVIIDKMLFFDNKKKINITPPEISQQPVCD